MTMEQSNTPKEATLLQEKMAKNPEAFDFGDIPDAKPAVQKAVSLEVMLGDISEEIVTAVGKFVVRPPKLKQQRQLIQVKRVLDAIPVDAPDAEERYLDALIALAQCVLCVEEGQAIRGATAEEIEAAFDAHEVQEIVARATGWKAQEGEQGDPPAL